MTGGSTLLALAGIALIWLGIRLGRIVLDWAEQDSPDTGNDDPRLVEVATGGNELLPGGHGGVKAAGRRLTGHVRTHVGSGTTA